jgi:16S rRNA (adenine1518-N6/adenine1519-N6)-dimethyltransferase
MRNFSKDKNMDHENRQVGEKSFRAKKSLGQNFLHAPHIVGKMIHDIGVDKTSTVLEAGPGKGVLTRGLLDTGARVLAVEKDDRAIPFLSEKFAPEIASGQLTVIHGDILEFDPKAAGLARGKYLVAANIPYYITGEFLRTFLETDCAPQKMMLMLQKEVAKRITGGTDGKKESILSISVKAYGIPKYIETVPARHFRPVPKVDSALILIDAISKDFFMKNGSVELSESDFFTIVKTGFAHKRKVLIKNLENLIPRDVLTKKWQEMGLSPTIRAEDLTLEQWRSIALFSPATHI